MHFPRRSLGTLEGNQTGKLTIASASAVVGSTVCFTSTLVFSRFEIDLSSFASSGLTFFELNLGTVSLISRLGLDGAMVDVAVTNV